MNDNNEMNRLVNFGWDDIKQETAEGALLARAICVLGWAKFRDKTPSQILEFCKDTILHPFINEPAEETFKRLSEKHQSKNN